MGGRSSRLQGWWCLGLLFACGDSGTPAPPATRQDAAAHDARVASDEDAATNPGVYRFPCLSAASREPTRSPDFISVYLEVFCAAGCTNWYCHGSRGAWGDLDLGSMKGAYANLIGVRSGKAMPVDNRPTCSDSPLLRVDPGHPEQSLLYLKVAKRAPCGSMMPPPDSGLAQLSASALEHVEGWIRAGAPFENVSGGMDASVQGGEAASAE